MKTLIMAAVMLCLGVTIAVSQKLSPNKIPDAVKSGFKKQFPAAKKIKWEMENSAYEVNFRLGKIQWAAIFDSTGTVVETEETLMASAIPASISETLGKIYPGYKIEKAERLTAAQKEPVYEIEIEKNEQSLTVQLSADGKVLTTKEEKEKD